MAENKTELTPKESIIQVVKFVVFSMGSGVIQTVVFTILNEKMHFDYWQSYLPAIILGVLYGFTVNRRFTFKSANNVPIAMAKLAFYYCIFIPTSTYLGDLAESAGVNEYIVLVVTMLSNLITAFLVNRFWIYKDSMNTNKLAQKEKEKRNSTDK